MEANAEQPLYKQLVLYIRGQIESGDWPLGEQIPSERDLCNQFSVSRITVRQAIAEAENEGLLHRVQGKGTFVAKPKINQTLQKMTTFKETMNMWGLKPRTRIHHVFTEPSDLQTAALLGLTDGEPVVRLEMVGYGDEIPMVYYSSTLPQSSGWKLVDAAKEMEQQEEGFSTYDLYRVAGCEQPHMLRQTYEVAVADSSINNKLKTEIGSPVFKVTSIFCTKAEEPVEFRVAYYRGDKYKFYITRYLE